MPGASTAPTVWQRPPAGQLPRCEFPPYRRGPVNSDGGKTQRKPPLVGEAVGGHSGGPPLPRVKSGRWPHPRPWDLKCVLLGRAWEIPRPRRVSPPPGGGRGGGLPTPGQISRACEFPSGPADTQSHRNVPGQKKGKTEPCLLRNNARQKHPRPGPRNPGSQGWPTVFARP